jgi:hypothetical protein
MLKSTISIVMITAVWAGSVNAADMSKPGLWEMTTKSDAMKSVETMQSHKMTPEQMEKMRQMGLNIPQMQDGAMVMKMCITKEMTQREHPAFSGQSPQHESECKTINQKHTGTSYSADIICDGPSLKGEGKLRSVMAGSDSYSTTYDFKGTSRGKPVSHHTESSAKWLGTDCGNVKPMSDYMSDMQKMRDRQKGMKN